MISTQIGRVMLEESTTCFNDCMVTRIRCLNRVGGDTISSE